MMKCEDCGHEQTVNGIIGPDGRRYFGSAFDFCDMCDGVPREVISDSPEKKQQMIDREAFENWTKGVLLCVAHDPESVWHAALAFERAKQGEPLYAETDEKNENH